MGVNAIQLFTAGCCVHCIILNKLKVINYPLKIPPNDAQRDHLLSEMILFGDDLGNRH